MATRGIVHTPVDRQIVGQELRATYGLEYIKRIAADSLAAFYRVSGALGTEWTVTANANGVKVAIPEVRRAVVSDLDGKVRLLQATAASPEGMDAFMPKPAAECYIGLRFEQVPHRASQLGAPTVSGGLAPFAYDLAMERIGVTGVPDSIGLETPGHTLIDVTTLCEGPWTNDTYTRQIVVWLNTPVTGGAEAIWTGTAALVDGAIVADVPHRFGQTSASSTASDYSACLLGPLVTADSEFVDIDDPTVVALAHVTGTTVDMSVQRVLSTAEILDDLVRDASAWVGGYQGGAGRPYGIGAFLGGNHVQSSWNDTTPSVDGTEVVCDFIDDPFTVAGISNAFFYAAGQFLREWAADAPDFADYRFAPGGAPGTFTICIEAVDETSGTTPKWTARLTTIAGTYVTAIMAGKVPLIQYDWTGAAVSSPTTIPLRMYRGERRLETIGGPAVLLAPDDGRPGSLALRAASDSGAGSRGKEQLVLLTGDDDETSTSLVAFERFVATRDGIPGYVLKVAAQANASAQGDGTEFAGLQFGGTGDLMVVGKKVGGFRKVAVVDALHPASDIVSFDEVGNVRGGDFLFTSYQDVKQRLAGRSVRGTEFYDTGYQHGPWFFGRMNSGRASEPWSTEDTLNAHSVHWLDCECVALDIAANRYRHGQNWIPIDFRSGDKLRDLAVYLQLCDTTDAADVEMTFEVIKVDYAGDVTVMAELKTGADRWVSAVGSNVAGWRTLVNNGKVTAGGADWGATAMVLDDDYSWYVRVYPAVWAKNPPDDGHRDIYFGCPYATIRRTKPFGAI